MGWSNKPWTVLPPYVPMCVTPTILEQNPCEFIDNISVSSWEIKEFIKLRVFWGVRGGARGLEAGELGFGVPEKWLSPPVCPLTGPPLTWNLFLSYLSPS